MQDLIDFCVRQFPLLAFAIVGIGLLLFFYSLLLKSSVFRYFRTAAILFFLLYGIGLLALQSYNDVSISHPGFVMKFLLMASLGIPIWASAFVELRGFSTFDSRQPHQPSWLSLVWIIILTIYATLYFTLFSTGRF